MKTVIPTLMHVDSDPLAGQQLHDAVQIQGGRHRFTQFICGPAAVAQLFSAGRNQRKGHPTVIVVDMDVDDGRGLDFIISVRAVMEMARIPIIVVHDGSHDQELLTAYQLGVSGVLEKPKSGLEWMDLADDLIRQYLRHATKNDDPVLMPLYLHRSTVAEACRL